MITIYKEKRLLVCGDNAFCCPVSLGSCPAGHKESEGDGRTPEGDYYICTVNRNSKFHIALGISYPNSRDARMAYARKRIGLIAYLRCRVSEMLGIRPPWNTPLGGFVMIHGESPDKKTGDWTAGCVALSNADIEKLASLAGKGERVRILP